MAWEMAERIAPSIWARGAERVGAEPAAGASREKAASSIVLSSPQCARSVIGPGIGSQVQRALEAHGGGRALGVAGRRRLAAQHPLAVVAPLDLAAGHQLA